MNINLEPKTLKMLIGGLDRLITMATRHPQPTPKDLEDLEEMIARRDELLRRLIEVEGKLIPRPSEPDPIQPDPSLVLAAQDSSSTSATFIPMR